MMTSSCVVTGVLADNSTPLYIEEELDNFPAPMHTFDSITVLLILLGAFSYINYRWVKLAPTIAYMLGALCLSLLFLCLKWMGFAVTDSVIGLVEKMDFGATVLYGILSFLLFAGSLQLDIAEMAREKWVVLTLATASVVLSTVAVGVLMFGVFSFMGMAVPLLYCLIFGALISPTDAVVVIAMLKGTRVPETLRLKITGEALFNDGIALVLFVLLTTYRGADVNGAFPGLVLLVVHQLFTSCLLGLALGWILSRLVRHVDSVNVQILMTLGFVAGGYDLAVTLQTSGPITVIVMGLFFRNYRPRGPDSRIFDREKLHHFWTFLDEFLSALLFVMMGLQLLSLPFSLAYFAAGLAAVVVVFVGRLFSVYVPIRLFDVFDPSPRGTIFYLTWFGLRGGISLAMAFSLPYSGISKAILSATYMVVIFSTVVQGLTSKKLLKLYPPG